MQVTDRTEGEVELTLNLDEFCAIKDCLNEVCNGFRMTDFRRRIGVERDVARRLLGQIVAPLRP